jgi:translation initiation factor eIF-2B subunit epsilon
VSGVQEIFIFCKSHSEKIKQYIAQSKWSSKTRSMALRIQVIVAPEANGIGDVMRELDAKSLIQTDFILVTGNVVSNMKLEAVLAEHKARRGLSTDALMTIVMKRATPHHRSRAHGEGALVAVDASTHECLHFEVVDRYPPKKRISLDSEIFAKHASVHIYNDLIDSQVDICSVEVGSVISV